MELADTILIGDVTVRPLRRLIIAGDTETFVDPLVMKLLCCLANNAGEVVTREEIIQTVWPGSFAGDQSLSRAIWGLRRALGDNADSPMFIETIPRIGYRLIPDAEISGASQEQDEDNVQVTVDSTRTQSEQLTAPSVENLLLTIKRLRVAVSILAGLVVLMLFAFVSGPQPKNEFVEVIKVRNADGTTDSTTTRSNMSDLEIDESE